MFPLQQQSNKGKITGWGENLFSIKGQNVGSGYKSIFFNSEKREELMGTEQSSKGKQVLIDWPLRGASQPASMVYVDGKGKQNSDQSEPANAVGSLLDHCNPELNFLKLAAGKTNFSAADKQIPFASIWNCS